MEPLIERDEYKKRIISLWSGVIRPGIDDLMAWLEESDFFVAPCSTIFHLAEPGGLAKHSLNVYYLLGEKVQLFTLGKHISDESVVICALGHDLCKVNFYVEDQELATPAQDRYIQDLLARSGRTMKWVGPIPKHYASQLIEALKAGQGIPDYRPAYKVEDQFPLGHGEKSLSILQDFIPLTLEEKLAIRWHMCAFDAGIHFNYPNGFPFRKASKLPLVTLLFTADYEASQILEAE